MSLIVRHERASFLPDVLYTIATFCAPREIGRLRKVNTLFYTSCDDSVFASHCEKYTRFLPAPFPTYELYYRCVVFGQTELSGSAFFGSSPLGVRFRGNLCELYGAFEIHNIPVIRLAGQRDTVRVLLLDRAEHVYVGIVATGSRLQNTRTLTGPQHLFITLPYVLPGMVVSLSASEEGLVVRRIVKEDEMEVLYVTPIPFPKPWMFAVAAGAPHASFAVL